ncbi:hypothetical protein [Vibrio salinus]|nr:hypothetical protein [Vibrio salinus]MCE0494566.1 hypothetical protein [Vibrio salinus]
MTMLKIADNNLLPSYLLTCVDEFMVEIEALIRHLSLELSDGSHCIAC